MSSRREKASDSTPGEAETSQPVPPTPEAESHVSVKNIEAVLLELSGCLLAASNETTVAECAVEVAAAALHADLSDLVLPDEHGQLKIRAARGWPPEIVPTLELGQAENSHAGYTILHGQPLAVEDYTHATAFSVPPVLFELGITSGLSAPLLLEAHAVGALLVRSRTPRCFTGDDVRLLTAIANYTAVALGKARLFEAAQRQLEELSTLHAVANVAAQAEGVDALIDRATRLIGETLYPDNFGVMLVDESASALRHHASYRGVTDEVRAVLIPLGRGITGHVAVTGRPWRVPDVMQEPNYVNLNPDARSELCVPLKVGERVIGVINAESTRPAAFTEADERLLITFAGQLATAIEKMRLFEAERAARQQAEALREVGAALSATLDFDDLLDRLLDQIARVVPYDSGNIMLVEQGRTRMARWRGYERWGAEVAAAIAALSFEVSATPSLLEMVETARPLVIADTADYPGWIELEATAHIRSWAGAPIIVQPEGVIAFFSLDKSEPGFYRPEHAERLAAFAGQAALALQNARLFEAERRRVAALTALHETGLDLSAHLDLPVLLGTIVERASRLLATSMGGLYLAQPDDQTLELVVSHNFPRDFTGTRLKFGEGLSGRVAQTAEPLTVDDYNHWPGRAAAYEGVLLGAVVGVPINWQGRVLGVITLIRERPHRFEPADAEMLSLFADQAAVAIVNARLFQETQRKSQELAGLYDTVIATGSVLETQVLLTRLYEQVRQILHPDIFAVAFYDQDAQELEVALMVEDGHELPRLSVPLGEAGLSGRVIHTRQPLLIGDLQVDSLGRDARRATSAGRSWLGVPLVVRDRTMGVVSVQSFRPQMYGEADRRFLESLAGQVAIALENARLYADVLAKANELGRLYAAAQDLGASLEPRLVLEQLAKHVTEALDATSGYVMEVNWEAETLVVLAEYWGDAAGPAERVSDLGRSYAVHDYPLTVWAVSSREVVNYKLGDADLPEAERGQMLEYGVQAALIVPIVTRDRVLGLIEIWESRRARDFTPAERRLAQTLVRQAAGVLENAQLFKALADEKRRLELLYNLGQSLTASLDPRAVATEALNLICPAVGALLGTLFVPQPGTDRLRLLAIVGANPAAVSDKWIQTRLQEMRAASADSSWIEELDRQINVRLGEGLAGWAAQQRTVTIAVDVQRDPRWITVAGLDDWVRSTISVPLIAGDELTGVLSLHSDRPGAFRAEHVPLLAAATTPVAAALQNARLYEAEARRVHYLTLLNTMTRTALETRGLPGMLQALAERLQELLAADGCYITLWDEAQQRVIPVAAHAAPQAAALPLDSSDRLITDSVLQAGHALVVEDVAQTAYLTPLVVERLNLHALIGLPLIAGEQKFGAAIVTFSQPHHFTPDEVMRAEQAAGQIALAVAKARLLDETSRHAEEVLAASEILRALNAVPEVAQAFPAIASGLTAISHCERVSLALLDEGWNWITIVAHDPPEVELSQSLRFPPSATAAAVDLLAGRLHLTADLEAEADFPVERALAQAGYRSRLNQPLRVGELVVGALDLVWRVPGGYSQANLTLLGQVADAVALAVEKNRLFAETRRRADELGTLVEVSTALRAARTREEMLPIFLQKAAEGVGVGAYTIFLLEPETGDLVMRGCYPSDPQLLGLRQRLGEGITGHVAATGQVHISADLTRDPLAVIRPDEMRLLGPVRSSITLPLRAQEQIVGVMNVGLYRLHTFNENEIGLLTAIAEIAGNALHRASVMETLEQRVAERTRELAEANERLKELDRLRDQFVSNVSHELRTPLTNIKLHLGLLERRGPEVLERYLPILQRETERLRRLIEDLLDLSRLRAQIASLRREPYPLNALVAEVVVTHATRAETHRVALASALSPDVYEVRLDRAQMIQVFTNLISNAVAYTPDGGHVLVSTALARRGETSGVTIRVHNDGPVIPPEDRPHLFERFYRGKTGRESGEPGTGLGLSICKDIVEGHGGYVTVESREGEGTAFIVWLPLST